MNPKHTPESGQFDEAERKLAEIFRDGLEHGFCRFSVTCEIIRDRKRVMTIEAGKLFRFVIPDEEIDREGKD